MGIRNPITVVVSTGATTAEKQSEAKVYFPTPGRKPQAGLGVGGSGVLPPENI